MKTDIRQVNEDYLIFLAETRRINSKKENVLNFLQGIKIDAEKVKFFRNTATVQKLNALQRRIENEKV